MINVGILGNGEVGQALLELYANRPFAVQIKDKHEDEDFVDITVLNICIPHSDVFFEQVKMCIEKCRPLLTIIHSTVLPGTTKHLQSLFLNRYIVHSPVRGNHPYLYDSLLQFTKYLGSDTEEGKRLAISHFSVLGLKSESMKNSFSTELAKILCTTYYGLCISWHQLAKDLCDQHNLNFHEVMTDWNSSYNHGYKQIHMEHVNRPVLHPPEGKIGGHCIIPNADLLDCLVESDLVKSVLKLK